MKLRRRPEWCNLNRSRARGRAIADTTLGVVGVPDDRNMIMAMGVAAQMFASVRVMWLSTAAPFWSLGAPGPGGRRFPSPPVALFHARKPLRARLELQTPPNARGG